MKRLATWIFIGWYNVDTILNYDRCKQILTILQSYILVSHEKKLKII